MLSRSTDLSVLVSVWPMVSKSVLDLEAECLDIPDDKQIRWLWAILEPDPFPAWVRHAGMPDVPHIRRLCYQAIDNYMVLPNGQWTLNAKEYFIPGPDKKDKTK
jgi:hypothetical protein